MDNENAGNAIGSTEPSVEEEAHFTPEMQALADRDAWQENGFPAYVCEKHPDRGCKIKSVTIYPSGMNFAIMQCGNKGFGPDFPK